MNNLPDWLLNLIPFLVAGAEKHPHFSAPRIIEAVIIAAITGGIVLYGTVQMLGAQVEAVRVHQHELSQDVRALRREFHDVRRDMSRK